MDASKFDLTTTASKEIGGLVNDNVSHTNAQVAQGYNSGASEARGLLNAPDHINDQLAFGTQAQTDAIKSRYNQDYGRQEKKLSLKMMMNADGDHIKALGHASELANEEVRQNTEKELLKHKISQANKKARAAVVGNVLGIVGAVVAGVYTGGAGAAAGYAAGEGVGNAVGGDI